MMIKKHTTNNQSFVDAVRENHWRFIVPNLVSFASVDSLRGIILRNDPIAPNLNSQFQSFLHS
jgi:hypothetical protein